MSVRWKDYLPISDAELRSVAGKIEIIGEVPGGITFGDLTIYKIFSFGHSAFVTWFYMPCGGDNSCFLRVEKRINGRVDYGSVHHNSCSHAS